MKIGDTAVETQDVQEIETAFCRLLKKPDAEVIVVGEEGQIIALIDLTFHKSWADGLLP